MRYNFKPTRIAYIDFETQSEAELTTVSKYVSHPSTRALTCVVKSEATGLVKFGPYLSTSDLELLAQIGATHTMCAHNASFDAAIWERVCKLPEVEWVDTLPMCRAAGLPGGLDDVGTRLTGRGKSKDGKRLIDMLCKVKPGRTPVVGPAHQLLLDYNVRDVELLEEVYGLVHQYEDIADVVVTDHAINWRGIPGDRARMEKLRELYALNSAKAREQFDELTDDVNPGSTKQMREWMGRAGFSLDKVNKVAWKSFLQEPETYFVGDGDIEGPLSLVKEAMELRREVVRVGGSKVDAALLVMDSDDRMREQLVHWGAHTGRWSARKLQPHNFPSASIGVYPEEVELTPQGVELAAEEGTRLLGRNVNSSDVLGALLRTFVTSADGVSFADYGAVELRAVAWLANCSNMLNALRDPKASLYLDTAERIFGERISKKDDRYVFVKALVLGSTYGMSGAKFEAMCKLRDVDTSALHEIGISVADTVKEFRKLYPELPTVWREYGDAVMAAVQGEPQEAGRCRFYMRDGHLHAELPSERCIVYRDAKVEMLVPAYCKMYNMPEIPVPTVTYRGPRFRGFLYGSKVCVGADTLVLTGRGVLPIVDVLPSDSVWDGVEWVSTDGPVCNGEREVGEWQGVHMTPDHTIHDGSRWRRAIALTGRAGGCSLEWAASSVPWSYANKNRTRGEHSCCARSAVSLGTALNCFCGRQQRTSCAYGVRTISEVRGCAPSIPGELSSLMKRCSQCGRIVGQASYPGAITRATIRTRITVEEAYASILSGWQTRVSSSHTQSRSTDGTILNCISTGSTTTAITSREICDSSQRRIAPEIAEVRQLERLYAQRSSRSRFKRLREHELVYDLQNCGPRNRYAIATGGGLAISHNCENIAQAICRDLLAVATVRTEQLGLRPIIHVHDELGCETRDLRAMLSAMSDPPEWAEGLPILVEGYTGNCWTKHGRHEEVVALDGRIL